VASPISAATVAIVGILATRNISLLHLLAITIPSTFLAVLIGALSVVSFEVICEVSDGVKAVQVA
jgi:anaerobic C4-dicarboxylate transporter